MDFFRKCARHTRFRLKYSHETPLYEAGPDKNKSVWNVLDRLNEKEQTIVFLYFRVGYSYQKIAEVLPMKESTVRVIAFRALEKLRKKCAKDFL